MPRKKPSGEIPRLKEAIATAKTAHAEANKAAALKNATEAHKAAVKTTFDKLTALQTQYRRDSFKAFATLRGTKLVKAYASLASLANRRNYTFDEADVDVLREAAKTAQAEMFAAFDSALQSQPSAPTASLIFNFK